MVAQKCKHATPGIDLFLQVRASFVSQGTSLNAWCLANDIHPSNARQCLTGAWNGPKGRQLRKRILAAVGLNQRTAA